MTDPVPPPAWEADVVATDGGLLHLRPIRPDDADALVAFHAGLSQRTRYLRYFSAYPRIPARDLHRFANVDHDRRVAFAVWQTDAVVAVGRYEGRPGSDEAEVAFVVADSEQGRGIGSILLEHLAAAGRERGLRRFTAMVLAENRAMLRVFMDAGYEPERHFEGTEIELSFDIGETDTTAGVARDRERRSEAASIRRLLQPASVAVIGASADPNKIGGAVLRNLQRSGFRGTVHPVRPTRDQIGGLTAHVSVLDVPGRVDLAVVAVPGPLVTEVVAECGRKGVQGVVVISSGFAERTDDGGAGRDAQRELVRTARRDGMRVVGPNCLGVVNTDPQVSLNASLAPLPPLAGRAGFFSQSGALGVAVLGEAARRGLGVSTFVSAGNRADVSGNDLLQYWEDDPATDLAMMYLESFGNPRKFARLARRFGRRKPLVAVKSGRSGLVAGLRHTSVDLDERSIDALFAASGVIRVDNTGDMFDVALLLLTQPLPGGPRVGVVGNSTALLLLVADALDGAGLQLADLTDIGAQGTAADFGAALATTLAGEVDAVVAVFVPPLATPSADGFAAQLRTASATSERPIVSTFLGFDGVPAALAAAGEGAPAPGSVPSYPNPERAVAALARAVRYGTWRHRPPGRLPELPDVDAVPARELVARVLTDDPDGRPLTRPETTTLLAAFGVTVVPAVPVADPRSAAQVAQELGWPVALRGGGERYGVRLHLEDDADLYDAWATLDLPDLGADALVQPMVERGVDTVFGLSDDRSFGALVSFGVGGVATDLLGDRAYAVVPLTVEDATDLVRAPRAAPLLTGYHGGPSADLDVLADVAARLSRLADELPEVAALEMSPVVARADGCSVLDAHAVVAPPVSRGDTGPRRLRGL